MKHKTCKRMLALLLALTLLASLCACAQKQDKRPGREALEEEEEEPSPPSDAGKEADEDPQEDTDKGAPPKRPDKGGDAADAGHGDADVSGAPGTVEWTQDGAQSLALLRERISTPPVMFGVLYLGYVGGLFDEGFEAGFPAWLWETNEAVLRQYPFIEEIDAEHIIGGAGHLYCIIPVDENATLSINRVEWNPSAGRDDVTEVLYRSESGEPVLLFANLDGVAYEADTQIFVTDNSGTTCEWYPSLDANSYIAPCVGEDGRYYSADLTEYGWQNAPSVLAQWLAGGYSGMTALGLSGSDEWGMTWCVSTTAWESDRYAHFMLTFYPGDETGGAVDLDWVYDGETEYEEQWSGWWTIETALDSPSNVTLSLSRVGGKSYADTDGPMYISETYPMLISPSGEELVVAAGENGICLPFMTQSTAALVLTLAYG